MTDAPERITAWRDYPDGVTGRWSANTYDAEDAVEYIRADLVATMTEQARQAGFAAGIEAAAKILDEKPLSDAEVVNGIAWAPNAPEFFATEIRALTPGDTVTLTRERMDAIMDALYDLPEPTVSVASVNRLRAALATLEGKG